MLSYRHAFHAGNHADVLKHLVLVQVARYLVQKPAPFCYIDTHAGAGCYDLQGESSRKLGEYRDGIGRLWSCSDLPPAVADYVDQIRCFQGDNELKSYPGSPLLASTLLRPEDRLRLFELHSTEIKHLAANFRDSGRRIQVNAGDGFAGLKSLLPPPQRRGLILIDPSYETRNDYLNVTKALEDAIKRFATGTYALWYPRLARSESRQLPSKLKSLPAPSWLHVALDVRKAPSDGIGMYGSGMFLINPPWTLAETLKHALPWLTQVLAQDGGGGFVLEQQG